MKQYKNITEVRNRVKELDRQTCKKYIQEARKELIEEFEKILTKLLKKDGYTNWACDFVQEIKQQLKELKTKNEVK